MAYVFSSTKLEKRTEQFLPRSKEGQGEKEGGGWGNGSNNVCTYE
jgi:hypothetical protein